MLNLSPLEICTLLVKAGFADSLLTARGLLPWVQVQDVPLVPDQGRDESEPWYSDGTYGHGSEQTVTIENTDQGWIQTARDRSWYGGHNSGGWVGHDEEIDARYVEMGGQKFVVAYSVREGVNGSSYNYDAGGVEKRYIVALSEGQSGDMVRVALYELRVLIEGSGDKAMPEAIELARQELDDFKRHLPTS